MRKFIKKYFFYIVILLILIIMGVSFYGSRKIFEGITMPDKASMTMFNSNSIDVKPLSGSEISSIMIEIVNNVKSHDMKLHLLDSKFTSNDLSMNPDATKNQENITKILEVIKKHDTEILSLYPSYVPSPDLAGLTDGSLLKDKKTKLDNFSNHPFSPRECSLTLMNSDLADLNAKLAVLPPAPAPPALDTKREMLNSQISMKTQDITDLTNNFQDPNFTKCNPPLSTSDANSMYMGYQLKHISGIVMLQDIAINKIQESKSGDIVSSWSNLAMNSKST